VGRTQSGNLLINNGKITAYNVNIGRLYNGQIFNSTVTVSGPDAELNALNDQFVLHGSMDLGSARYGSKMARWPARKRLWWAPPGAMTATLSPLAQTPASPATI
jgi:hypothetical protein